jgi:hypothetical protein
VSQTHFVEFNGSGFWAYDVALGVFLKHLIDVAGQRPVDDPWLSEAIRSWRITATIPDCGRVLDSRWSADQIETFVEMAEEACARLSDRDSIPAKEMASWRILEDEGVFPRGALEVRTAPVVELGRAIVALARGELPAAPPGTSWYYGTPEGRRTIAMRQ